MFMVDIGAESYYSFFGLTPDASAAEIRAARDRMNGDFERKRLKATDPDERRRLEEKLKEIGVKGDTLARPEARAEYDRANVHLRFFIVEPAAPLYSNKADRLIVLDRVLRSFLASKGCEIPPLSDLDRSDFSADETRIDLLDELLE